MDAPYFGDIGKDAGDLFTEDLDHQKVKLKISSKSTDGFEFKTTGEHNREDSKTSGKIDLKYKIPDHGATYSEVWDLKNNLSARLELEKKVRQRPLKMEIGVGMFPLHESKIAADGAIKYSHTNAAFICSGKYEADGFKSNHSVIVGKSGLFLGGRVGFDWNKKQLEEKEVVIGMSAKSHQLTVGMSDDLHTLHCNLFHEANPTFSYAAKGQHCFVENNTKLAGAFKYKLNDISTIRGTLNSCGLLGLSYRQNIRPSVALTFSTEINALNFAAGNHKTGLSLELTP